MRDHPFQAQITFHSQPGAETAPFGKCDECGVALHDDEECFGICRDCEDHGDGDGF